MPRFRTSLAAPTSNFRFVLRVILSLSVSRKYARVLHKVGYGAEIQNIVSSCDVKFPIRLEGRHSRCHASTRAFSIRLAMVPRFRTSLAAPTSNFRFVLRVILSLSAPTSDFRFVLRVILSLSVSCKYARVLHKVSYGAEIQNIVGSSDVKFPIRLEGLVDSLAVMSQRYVVLVSCSP
jgi:hypothetical protein